ncbi:MAG: hypothetical protein IPK19_40970 [Chloroflexi bacterium]|nr:hypothetical protein [Chloroflexota bacterium]
MVKELLEQMAAARAGFGQERVYRRAVLMVLAEILSFGSHHVTDLLRSVGLVEEDWTAWYRLLQKPSRMQEDRLGRALVKQTLRHVEAEDLYAVGIDSTSVPRSSQQMEGSSWHKCPRNPPWRVGIHRAQRFVNVSWLSPLEQGYSRAIPLRWLPCFPQKAVRQVHEAQVEPQTGAAALTWLREVVDEQNPETVLLCLADGSYDRPDFWTSLPARTAALVRTAKNRVLKQLPPPYCGRGRRRKYGQRAPAPQDYLAQPDGWQSFTVAVRGHERRMVARVEGPFVREKMPQTPLMLLCVRGQTWKRTERKRRREPVFYLVNAVWRDGAWQLPFPLQTLLAWAWQRWELEVVHREVKSGFGLGDKQCFNPRAAVTSVQWSAWVYSLLTLTTYRQLGAAARPKRPTAWQRHPRRWTLQTVLDAFRQELATHPDFSWLRSPSSPNWPKFEAALLPLLPPSHRLVPF